MHLHKWKEWSLPVAGEAGRMYQFTRCNKCGQVKQRPMKKVGVTPEQIRDALQAIPGEDEEGLHSSRNS